MVKTDMEEERSRQQGLRVHHIHLNLTLTDHLENRTGNWKTAEKRAGHLDQKKRRADHSHYRHLHHHTGMKLLPAKYGNNHLDRKRVLHSAIASTEWSSEEGYKKYYSRHNHLEMTEDSHGKKEKFRQTRWRQRRDTFPQHASLFLGFFIH